ncbi:MAG TPA: PfkB family carbohydrate kinase [Candidatus Thermoplasmatota archaeon]|nr:PfkB family carbohydrate kinase [Candidatus Thermoplasmatota archaeon]
MSPQPVLVVGSIGLDDVETPFGKAQGVLGGSAVYASAAASLFAPVRFVGVCGEDLPADAFEFLRARGVDLSGLERVAGGKTFRWAGRYHFDMNARDTLLTELNTLATFDPKVPPAWRQTPFVFLGNLLPSIQGKVLDQLPSRPVLAVLDTMNYWIENAPSDLASVLKRVDVLVVNDSEARELARTPNLVKAAAAIRRMGPSSVVVKKGEHGALLFTDGRVFAAPALPLEEVFDPTGAGDAFAGGFVGSLAAEGRVDEPSLRRAVIAGSAVASFCVERFSVEGLRDRSPKEIEARIAQFRELAHWS